MIFDFSSADDADNADSFFTFLTTEYTEFHRVLLFLCGVTEALPLV